MAAAPPLRRPVRRLHALVQHDLHDDQDRDDPVQGDLRCRSNPFWQPAWLDLATGNSSAAHQAGAADRGYTPNSETSGDL